MFELENTVSPLIKNKGSNDRAVQILQGLQETSVANLCDNAFEINLLLNKDEEKYISTLLYPRPITWGKMLKHHPHPVPAILNRLAYESCIEEANMHERCIDIGGHPLRTPAHHHLCAKITTAREHARYAESAWMQMQHTTKFDYTNFIKGKHNYCTSGAEFCNYKADYAYAINVYDLTLQQIADIFEAHSLSYFDLWIFLPHRLLDIRLDGDESFYSTFVDCDAATNNFGDSKNKQRFGFDRAPKDKIRFALNDNSNIYEHNYENWRAYFEYTKIQGKNFEIVIEHKKSFGTFTHIRFMRVDKVYGDIIKRVINLPLITKRVFVPDIIKLRKHHFATRVTDPRQLHGFFVDSSFVDKCLSWLAQLKDDMFKFDTFATYCNAIRGSIRYNSSNTTEMVYHGIDIDEITFNTIKQSVFVIGAILRHNRTGNLARIFKHMKTNSNEGLINVIIAKIKDDLRNAIFPLSDLFEKDGDSISPCFIMNLRVYQLPVFTFSAVYPVRNSISFRPIMFHKKPVYSPSSQKQDDKPVVNVVANKKNYSINADLDKQHIIKYDPPGDGRCGYHIVKHLKDDYIIPDASWLVADDLCTLLNKFGFSVYMHYGMFSVKDQKKMASVDIVDGIKVCIDLSDGHYRLLEICDCCKYNTIITDFAIHKLDPKYCYVNITNNTRADSTAVNVAFVKHFPNYYKGIAVGDTRTCHILKKDGIHCCIISIQKDDAHKTFNDAMLQLKRACDRDGYQPFIIADRKSVV